MLTMVGTDDRATDGSFGLEYVFSVPSDDLLIAVRCAVPATEAVYPSVTPRLPAAHWYEREARDLLGVLPIGHPDPRRLVLHDDWPRGYHPLRKDVDGHLAPAPADHCARPSSSRRGRHQPAN